MHRHRNAWFVVRSSSRTAATAARTKPVPDDPAVQPKTLGKWARPPPAPSSNPSTSQLPPPPLSVSQRPPVQCPPLPGFPSVNSKWARPPPLVNSTSAIPPFPAKWGRSSPQVPPALKLDAGSRSQLLKVPSPSENSTGLALRQIDRRLQRDPAPHQDPSATQQNPPQRHRQQPHSASGSQPKEPQKPQTTSWEPGATLEPDPRRPNSHSTRPERSNRLSYKERGTLLSKSYRDQVTVDVKRQAQKQKVTKVTKKVIAERKVSVDVYIPSTVSVGALARLLGVRLERLQHQMHLAGMADEAKYDHVLTSDYAVLLAEEFGQNPIVNDEAAFDIYPPSPHPDPSTLQSRPPIITIMGHVDHGKTTLLDNLRSASVAHGEAGGITQHIGAFSVLVPASSGSKDGPQSITFLDTPGHSAFSAMRARGAGVTDIVVLVVAVDDGVMPQTREVIQLIKKDESKVGVVVALNKVDKPGADVDAVQKALLAENIQLEVFGGDIPSVEVSGLTGLGLPTLVETLSTIAEMQDLRAERDGPIQGYVLESKVHKGLGPVATVLILRGCLKPGSHIISGLCHAKVRVMNDSTGAQVKAAYPGMAITISGWKTLPDSGDEVLQGTEAEVKKAIANRRRKAEIEATLVDVEAINMTRREEHERRKQELEAGEVIEETSSQGVEQGPKELRLIIKADVSGSAEAVEGALQGIGNKEATTRIISSGVGDVSESDVMMAKAVGGSIVGFSVHIPRAIETLAAQNEVAIISSNVIYRIMDMVKNKVITLLPLIIETRVTGEAVILQLFDIQLKAKQTKKVAGCRVTNGVVEKSKFARLIRNGTTAHEGLLDTMRILKKDVTEIRKGTECGLCFGPTFSDLQEGDIIQMYEKVEKPGVL